MNEPLLELRLLRAPHVIEPAALDTSRKRRPLLSRMWGDAQGHGPLLAPLEHQYEREAAA